jgi:hypothetical protein
MRIRLRIPNTATRSCKNFKTLLLCLFGKETAVAAAAVTAVTGGLKQVKVWTEQVGGVKSNYWSYVRCGICFSVLYKPWCV